MLLFSMVGGKVDVKPSFTNLLKSSIAAHATRFRPQHTSMYASNGINVGANGDALSAEPARKYAFAEVE